MSYLDTEIAQLNVWEGDIPHAYLDTCHPPNVTTGKGYLIASLSSMQELPWKIPGTLAPATPDQIVQEWNRVRAMPGGMAAAAYASPFGLILLQSDIDALTMKMLLVCDADLRKDYPGYDSFPDEVKIALLDMEWNLGDAKLRNSYPHFDSAIMAQNWAVAATECARNASNKAFSNRNAWTVSLFQEAAKGAA